MIICLDDAVRYDGTPPLTQVKVTVDRTAGERRSRDFTGTSYMPTIFDAPSSVAMPAVLERGPTLVDKDIRYAAASSWSTVIYPVDPRRPHRDPRVVAGNVETSEALTGRLYAGLVQHGGKGPGHDEDVTFPERVDDNDEDARQPGAGAGEGFDGTGVVAADEDDGRGPN